MSNNISLPDTPESILDLNIHRNSYKILNDSWVAHFDSISTAYVLAFLYNKRKILEYGNYEMPNGWFYVTRGEFLSSCRLKKDKLLRITTILKEGGFIETCMAGNSPKKKHYRLSDSALLQITNANFDKDILKDYTEKQKFKHPKKLLTKQKTAENTGSLKNRQPEVSKTDNSLSQKPPLININNINISNKAFNKLKVSAKKPADETKDFQIKKIKIKKSLQKLNKPAYSDSIISRATALTDFWNKKDNLPTHKKDKAPYQTSITLICKLLDNGYKSLSIRESITRFDKCFDNKFNLLSSKDFKVPLPDFLKFTPDFFKFRKNKQVTNLYKKVPNKSLLSAFMGDKEFESFFIKETKDNTNGLSDRIFQNYKNHCQELNNKIPTLDTNTKNLCISIANMIIPYIDSMEQWITYNSVFGVYKKPDAYNFVAYQLFLGYTENGTKCELPYIYNDIKNKKIEKRLDAIGFFQYEIGSFDERDF